MARSLERIVVLMLVVLARAGEPSSGTEVGLRASVERSSALSVLSEHGCGLSPVIPVKWRAPTLKRRLLYGK